jgi:uncharacterized protein (DUF2126 family)/transglutaminase-like putative cysteine protease
LSIHVALNHVTHYRYDRRVSLSPQIIRLRPAPHCRTRVLSYSLRVTPAQHFINWQQDPQANYLARVVFPEKVDELKVEVDLVAEMSVLNPFDFFLEPQAEKFPFSYSESETLDLAPFRMSLPATTRFADYLRQFRRKPKEIRTIDFLVDLNSRLAKDIRYLIRMEPGVQLPEETLQLGSGSCRDSAWLLAQLLRHLGMATRFVSGYLIQLVPDVKSLDGPSGAAEDFTDLHAWCEVYLPGAGWIGLDPTSGLLAGEGHIPVACAPEPTTAAPVSGEVEDCEAEFSHAMSVKRIWEAPRVTKPYTDEQWQTIDAMGERIDRDLHALDVRLTMGGEPTFVSVDDPEGAEWNTAAQGPTKRKLAADLYHRLREKYGAQGLVHFGQGKWYPGEQLPRWSLNCFWRRDGEPIWHDPKWIADESVDYGGNEKTAQDFLLALAERLGIAPKNVFAAYEDAFYYLWRERRLPSNVDPFDSKLADELERERLMKLFEDGLQSAVGHVLPIARNTAGSAWESGTWFLRTERCYLIPGDSPIGYRLPLDSQPWVRESQYPYVYPTDPTETQAPLPLHSAIRRVFQERQSRTPPDTAAKSVGERAPEKNESADWITRSALCAQTRNGVLYIFMPPLKRLEDYLELTTALEATSAQCSVPIILEGYEPPRDSRLQQFRVTPDPGVIEVNIHPSSTWRELSDRTQHLYEQARLSRLGTEKFMLDGRHTGTGGGNHFVLGGATTLDSPFLRRPDLLRSLISYWHNHPSLSYLFSGLFIGPTSQAPRVDEARNDSLYELEVAFRQFPDSAGTAPWLIDRLLRNLLIDVAGNTHRAEFCIDKLYSPDGPTGRLGLVEMRAFEMPPHAQMSLAQQLLLRSLLSRFWRQPYAPAKLTRWGTELHDRFMLPYFVRKDFDDVLEEQSSFGYALDPAWFDPHFEFRFPHIGDYALDGTHIDLRQALEPWHVMGEEGAPGGAVRYVDSSVERLQIHVTGLAPDRYTITCNGVPVPLRPTGAVGEFIAGVRYRAWQPPNALHPTIGVHAPLTFDLVDTWMRRSRGGCRYHVSHPGGRSNVDFPVNAFAAESRRLARFFRMGHTPGTTELPIESSTANADFPFTLDLRKQ